MPDVIICANFGIQKLRGLGNMGGQIWALPLKRLVTLTTVLRYRTACDYVISLNQSKQICIAPYVSNESVSKCHWEAVEFTRHIWCLHWKLWKCRDCWPVIREGFQRCKVISFTMLQSSLSSSSSSLSSDTGLWQKFEMFFLLCSECVRNLSCVRLFAKHAMQAASASSHIAGAIPS